MATYVPTNHQLSALGVCPAWGSGVSLSGDQGAWDKFNLGDIHPSGLVSRFSYDIAIPWLVCAHYMTIWLYVGAFEPCESNITPRKNCHFFQEMGLFGFEALIFLAIFSKRFHFRMWFAGYFDQICGIRKLSLFWCRKAASFAFVDPKKKTESSS